MNKLVKEPVVISIVMLFVGIFNAPDGYYTLLRIIVFLTSSYLAFFAFQNQKRAWGWIFCFCLILFNPFIPIHFYKGTWAGVDFVAAILIVLFMKKLEIKNSKIIMYTLYCLLCGGLIYVTYRFCTEHGDKRLFRSHLRLLR
jgi:hypothetical protein